MTASRISQAVTAVIEAAAVVAAANDNARPRDAAATPLRPPRNRGETGER